MASDDKVVRGITTIGAAPISRNNDVDDTIDFSYQVDIDLMLSSLTSLCSVKKFTLSS